LTTSSRQKEGSTGSDTTALEQETDRLVYGLYDLTPAVIKAVEESAAK
jgi:hypothetical protein